MPITVDVLEFRGVASHSFGPYRDKSSCARSAVPVKGTGAHEFKACGSCRQWAPHICAVKFACMDWPNKIFTC
jgi:hypothetical protein